MQRDVPVNRKYNWCTDWNRRECSHTFSWEGSTSGDRPQFWPLMQNETQKLRDAEEKEMQCPRGNACAVVAESTAKANLYEEC